MLADFVTRAFRRHLVGSDQIWAFHAVRPGWEPPPIKRTSLYLHVPFCRHCCPYCPYTKVSYDENLVGPYAEAAAAEIDWWADRIGPAEVTSIYIGGGTPTVALDGVAAALDRVDRRFRVTGDICMETNPADVDPRTVRRLQGMGVSLISLGVESFSRKNLDTLGRRYEPEMAERAVTMLAEGDFSSRNVDIMFALPGECTHDVIHDLARAAELGADQITTYPLFTFPYTSVGEYMRLHQVRMPDIRTRRAQYRAISNWCREHDFQRVSVWGFKRGRAPRYSSVTRDGYIGIGPGAGSHLPGEFVLNTFDLRSWSGALSKGRSAVALQMAFSGHMSGWWWLYWRLYDTRIPLDTLDSMLGDDAGKARRWLASFEHLGLAERSGNALELTDSGAFWLHLAQNQFALNYVNTLWTACRREPWPSEVAI